MSHLDNLIAFAYNNASGGIPPLPHQEVENARESMGLTPSSFFDCFARRVAHQYFEGKLSFEFADCAINSLHAYCQLQYDVSLPSYAEDVYAAFDQGEFRHREDDASVDPEVKYTRPAIQAIVVRDRVLGAAKEQS